MQKIEFLSIGDIAIDAFIRLKEASIHCTVDRQNCELCMRFAEKIPYEFVEVVKAVGNSPNAAVSAARLGLASAIVTNVGDDENGKACMGALNSEGVAVDYVSIELGKKTNYHYVLWYEDERTILVKHEAYEYKLPSKLPESSWVYLSSIGDNSEPYHDEIASFLKAHHSVKLAFQPGTFQIRLGAKRLQSLYERAEVFFCNVEEAKRITGRDAKPPELLKLLHELGPYFVIITDGPRGAYAYNGKEAFFQPPYPDPKPPYERTGAGDAFSSTVTTALALGKSFEEALLWGPVNSMSVVQQVGAQKGLLTREQLEAYLAKAPSDYHLRGIG